jgi:PAS domain S-box-containing protein
MELPIVPVLAHPEVLAWQCVAGAIALAATVALVCGRISRAKLSQAFERHRRDEARLRAMLGQMPAVVWTTDRDLRITSAEGAAMALMGLRHGETVGMTLPEYFRTDDRAFVPLAAHHRALDGHSSTYEFTWQSLTLHVHCEPLRNATGEIVGTVGAALDITPRKRAELALARSEAKNGALLTAIPDVMFRLSRDGKLLEFIDKLVTPNPNYIGADVRQVFPPDVGQQLLDAAAKAVQTRETQVFEYQTTTGRGRPRYFEARVVACCGDEALAIVRNVTERRVAEDELRRREAQLRSIVRTLPDLLFQLTRDGRFAGCVAHNPDDLVAPVDDLLGRPVTDMLPPAAGALVLKHVRLAVETGRPQVCRYPLELRGETRWFEARIVAAEDGSDFVMAHVRNITDLVNRPAPDPDPTPAYGPTARIGL